MGQKLLKMSHLIITFIFISLLINGRQNTFQKKLSNNNIIPNIYISNYYLPKQLKSLFY